MGEYLRAVIDAGLIRPSWGLWELHEGGLDALKLSPDVLSLILARADGLGSDSRLILAIAAAIGVRFRSDQLACVCRLDEHRILEVLRVAVDRRLVGAATTGSTRSCTTASARRC